MMTDTTNCPTCGHTVTISFVTETSGHYAPQVIKRTPTPCVPAERLAEAERDSLHNANTAVRVTQERDEAEAQLAATIAERNAYWAHPDKQDEVSQLLHMAEYQARVAEKRVEVLVEAMEELLPPRDELPIPDDMYARYDALLADSGLAAAKERIAGRAMTKLCEHGTSQHPTWAHCPHGLPLACPHCYVPAEDVRAVVAALKQSVFVLDNSSSTIGQCYDAVMGGNAALDRPAIKKLMEETDG